MTTKVPASMTSEAVTAAQVTTATSNAATALSTANAAQSTANNAVTLTGDQTIAGAKTFSTQPVLPQKLTQMTAVASTSGTSIDFTGIPSWAKRITVLFSGVSTSGTSPVQLQFGTGGTPTYVTSGYASNAVVALATVAATSSTTGIVLTTNCVASDLFYGSAVVNFVTGTSWSGTGLLTRSGSAGVNFGAGGVSLGAALTAVRITTVGGSDTFDAGTIDVYYE